jgi:hypothetical protein
MTARLLHSSARLGDGEEPPDSEFQFRRLQRFSDNGKKLRFSDQVWITMPVEVQSFSNDGAEAYL